MDPSNNSSYKDLYVKTAREFLVAAQSKLPAFATTPTDAVILEELVRSAHSVKGESLTMGYQKTGEVAHLLEDLLRGLLDKSRQITPETIGAVSEGFNALMRSVDTVERESKEADVSGTIKKLEALKI